MDKIPQRIVSLVPSQTELLFDLGLEQQVVGITKFCVYPKNWRSQKALVGGTKKFRFETIENLVPDLIIGNKEENYKEGIERLRSQFPVWTSDISNLADALVMIRELGKLTNTEAKAEELIKKIRTNFDKIPKISPKSVLYLIWQEPYMAVGKNTFIDDMLAYCSLENCILESRYPQLSVEQIQKLAPKFIFLSSEPYPFSEKQVAELQVFCPDSHIFLVDGEKFSWYGSRLLETAHYFEELIQKIDAKI